MCRPEDAARIADRVHAPLRVIGRAHGDPIDPDHFALFTRSELGELRDWVAEIIAA
jgi:hypothetical protein